MEKLDKSFGLVIAFLLPGFICLFGLSPSFPELGNWLQTSSADKAPSIGGFFFSTLASLSIGVLISAIRWLIMDHLLHWTGAKAGKIDQSKLKDEHTLAAYQQIVENYYRYYQNYANSFISVLIVLIAYPIFTDQNWSRATWVVGVAILVVLFLASRNCLKNCYEGQKSLIGK